MAKTLNQFIEGYLKVKSADEQKFIDKHVTAKNPDRNGNGDDVFKGNTKTIDRRKDRKGYNPGEDEKVYEGYHVMRNGQSISYHQDKESADKRASTSNMRGGSNATVVKDDRSVKEELKGSQHKIDANKNGKVDAHDFKLLRKKKKVAEEAEELEEKLTAKTPMGKYIKDFQKSDAPQFKGKSAKKRQVMAIAAKLSAERGGKPLRKEERLQDRLNDLSESHQRTMLTVFEKLSDDNQSKFLEACNTPEGVEKMLDFAINNRGE